MLDIIPPSRAIHLNQASLTIVCKVVDLLARGESVNADRVLERTNTQSRYPAQSALIFLEECGLGAFSMSKLKGIPEKVGPLVSALAVGDLATLHRAFLAHSGYGALWGALMTRGSLEQASSRLDVRVALGCDGQASYFNYMLRMIAQLDQAWIDGNAYRPRVDGIVDADVSEAVVDALRGRGVVAIDALVPRVCLACGTTPNQVVRLLSGLGREAREALGIDLVPTPSVASRAAVMGSVLSGTMTFPTSRDVVVGRLFAPDGTFDSAIALPVSRPVVARPSMAPMANVVASDAFPSDDFAFEDHAVTDGGVGFPAQSDPSPSGGAATGGDVGADDFPGFLDLLSVSASGGVTTGRDVAPDEFHDVFRLPQPEGRIAPYPSPAAFEAVGFTFGDRGMGLPYGWALDAPDGWAGDFDAFAWDERGRERVRRVREGEGVMHRLLPRFAVSLVDAGVDRMLAVPAGQQCFGIRDAGRLALSWEAFDAEETGAYEMFLAEVGAWLDLVLPGNADPTRHWDLACLPADGAGATRYPASVTRGRVTLPAALAQASTGLVSLGFDFDPPLADGSAECFLPPGWRAGGPRWSVVDALGRERIGPAPGGVDAVLRTRFEVAAVVAGSVVGMSVGLGHGRAVASVLDAGVPIRISNEHAVGDVRAASAEAARMQAFLDGQRPEWRNPHAYWSVARTGR